MIFPALVYRCPGKFQARGTTYDYAQVLTDADISDKIKDGWAPDLQEAITSFLNTKEGKWDTQKGKSSQERSRKSDLAHIPSI